MILRMPAKAEAVILFNAVTYFSGDSQWDQKLVPDPKEACNSCPVSYEMVTNRSMGTNRTASR